MSHLRALLSAMISPLLVGTGCIAAPVDEIPEDVAESASEVSGNQDHSRIVTNGLSAAFLMSSREALINLSERELTPSTIAASPLMNDTEGRSLLAYVITCAFDWEAKVTVSMGGKTSLFEGGIGLAPAWAERAITRSEERWMTACLLAHANALGRKVPLSLRGSHPALATTTDEELEFTVEEGAYYGNLFDRESVKPEVLACAGTSSEDPCASVERKWLVDRVCADGNASESACGFFVVGTCFGSDTDALRACNYAGPSGYRDCFPKMHEAEATLSRTEKTAGYAEVITVFLRADPSSIVPLECVGSLRSPSLNEAGGGAP
jgi:hypothetical protein